MHGSLSLVFVQPYCPLSLPLSGLLLSPSLHMKGNLQSVFVFHSPVAYSHSLDSFVSPLLSSFMSCTHMKLDSLQERTHSPGEAWGFYHSVNTALFVDWMHGWRTEWWCHHTHGTVMIKDNIKLLKKRFFWKFSNPILLPSFFFAS